MRPSSPGSAPPPCSGPARLCPTAPAAASVHLPGDEVKLGVTLHASWALGGETGTSLATGTRREGKHRAPRWAQGGKHRAPRWGPWSLTLLSRSGILPRARGSANSPATAAEGAGWGRWTFWPHMRGQRAGPKAVALGAHFTQCTPGRPRPDPAAGSPGLAFLYAQQARALSPANLRTPQGISAMPRQNQTLPAQPVPTSWVP